MRNARAGVRLVLLRAALAGVALAFASLLGLGYLRWTVSPLIHSGGDIEKVQVHLASLRADVRMLALGDSHTEGPGVGTDETYPRLLEKVLNQKAGYARVRIVNAGVGGACVIEKHTLYRRLVNTPHDWVLLQIGVDLERIGLHLLANRGQTGLYWKVARKAWARFPTSPLAEALWKAAVIREQLHVGKRLRSPEGAAFLRETQDVLIAEVNGIYERASRGGHKLVIVQYGEGMTGGGAVREAST